MAVVDLTGDGGVLKRVLRAAPEGAAQPDTVCCCAEGSDALALLQLTAALQLNTRALALQ